jgi:hypothetical protein
MKTKLPVEKKKSLNVLLLELEKEMNKKTLILIDTDWKTRNKKVD